jgi:hypothetical protein
LDLSQDLFSNLPAELLHENRLSIGVNLAELPQVFVSDQLEFIEKQLPSR